MAVKAGLGVTGDEDFKLHNVGTFSFLAESNRRSHLRKIVLATVWRAPREGGASRRGQLRGQLEGLAWTPGGRGRGRGGGSECHTRRRPEQSLEGDRQVTGGRFFFRGTFIRKHFTLKLLKM